MEEYVGLYPFNFRAGSVTRPGKGSALLMELKGYEETRCCT